ncbi:MAG: class I SAM-dependent methyltransferase [Rhodomicrobium sp.]
MKEIIAAQNLKDVSSHFAFGKNWSSFAATITEDAISEAAAGLSRLFSGGELAGASFFDIGCGSGLSMLAAKRLGAANVNGIDIDPDSVRTAQTVLAAHMTGPGWDVQQKSVFDLDPRSDGRYDIVHSWGVLHHTGDMWPAIEKAAALVKPGGYFALALYRRTPLCGFWTWEKRFYSKASAPVCAVIRLGYKTLYIAGLAATGRNPLTYIRAYRSNRGMDWHHDVHDWLGGYPYESVAPAEVKVFLDRLGFSTVRSFEKPAAIKGFFGTHCDEFLMVRR